MARHKKPQPAPAAVLPANAPSKPQEAPAPPTAPNGPQPQPQAPTQAPGPLPALSGFRVASRPGRPSRGPLCSVCGAPMRNNGVSRTNHPFLVRVNYRCTDPKCPNATTVQERRS